MSETGTGEEFFEESHGFLSRLLHRCAFSFDLAHRVLLDLEDYLYRGRLEDVSIHEPVFIAGLPRSGTTLLQRVLVRGGPFASHTHREVPFVLSPLIWNEYADWFGGSIQPRERAHGDGMTVGERTPAALEEVIWKFFWPSHYRQNSVVPWKKLDSSREFQKFFRRHISKIKLLRDPVNPNRLRYVSKNNFNLARLKARPAPLDEGQFLVPFRHPLDQGISLRNQHRRFLRIHQQHPFVAEYMNFLGHHEFGKCFRAIRFDRRLVDERNPNELEYWVRYWIQAYREVLDCDGDRVHLWSYDAFVRRPKKMLGQLEEILDIPGSSLVEQGSSVRSPRKHRFEGGISSDIKHRALDLHEELEGRTINETQG